MKTTTEIALEIISVLQTANNELSELECDMPNYPDFKLDETITNVLQAFYKELATINIAEFHGYFVYIRCGKYEYVCKDYETIKHKIKIQKTEPQTIPYNSFDPKNWAKGANAEKAMNEYFEKYSPLRINEISKLIPA